MFRQKSRVIVGLTTYYNENLIISMSGLARLGKNITLVIHNDNPDIKLSRRRIRHMGFQGRLHIINSDYNKGTLDSRLEIIKYAKEHNLMEHTYTMGLRRMFDNYFPKYDPDNFGCGYCGDSFLF